MALAKLKTKTPVVIDSMTGATSIICMEVYSVSVTSDGYTSDSNYMTIDENGAETLIKRDTKFFTRAQSIALFTILGAEGSNFDQQLFSLIPKVALYRLGVAAYWGLTSNDWEIYE